MSSFSSSSSSGDLNGSLRLLERLLRLLRFTGPVDYSGLSSGNPAAFLPIVSFSLTSWSPAVTQLLVESGLEFSGKTDLRFTDTLYKVLRDVFQYKPVLSRQQFLQPSGFSQRKISVTCDIINLVVQKHQQLNKVCGKSVAVNKKDNPFPSLSCGNSRLTYSTSYVRDTSSVSPEVVMSQLTEQEEVEDRRSPQEEKDESQELSEVKVRLSAVEAQLQDFLSRLDRLRVLENRLEELERNMEQKTTVAGDELISVSRQQWENLLSRILLLETRAELQMTSQVKVSPSSSLSQIDPPDDQTPHQHFHSALETDELRNKLQSITHLLKSTSRLLKTSESSSLELNDCSFS